ncbi:MAG TPA: hypothetical protein VFU45_08795, partial [Gemmatimonadales bacterium]|nr:hypothetical protein [Gemmatimonadales bacterium]
MRRVAFVGPGEEGDAAWRWLAGLREVASHCYPGIAAIPLVNADVVWLHGEVAPDAVLVPWLERGGRLLCTGPAALIPSALGLESVAPDERRVSTWHHAEDEFWFEEFRSFVAFPHVRGLAGFGPHPLFEGLHQGTYTWAPAEGEPFDWVTYRQARPAEGRVVAVERSFIHLNAGRVIAWEQGVGAGGILAIGAYTHFNAADPLLAPQLRALVANAVVGEAIPGPRRTAMSSTWPAPGGRARIDDLLPPVELPDLTGAWRESRSPLAIVSDASADDPWTLAGRRMLLVGSEQEGLREVWAHPHRVVRDVAVSVGGRPARGVSARIAPDQVGRVLADGGVERWTAALEHPAMLWD